MKELAKEKEKEKKLCLPQDSLFGLLVYTRQRTREYKTYNLRGFPLRTFKSPLREPKHSALT